MYQPIQSLRGSRLHRTNVELYKRHHDLDDSSGRCVACGDQHPCQVAEHAAWAIRVAGEDPHWYDELPGNGQTAVPRPAVTQTPVYTGYAVGGHGRRTDLPDDTYER